ncbi:MAG: nucleotidyltransferase family protein [Candidatus Protistobacter heckmanni]|nr:nucleotidyltransferase family protein [Candidatus Protistobacter heckmanni]
MRAMIFAAGRGERMRPLTDATPKPLLEAGGKPLIVWTVERLAAAGWTDIVINHAWLGGQIEAALGDGARWGARIRYSAEGEALETAGGVAKALPLLGEGVFLAVSGDIYADYDYAALRRRALSMPHLDAPRMHLVLAPNPDFHPEGDFALLPDGRLALEGEKYTFANIGLYDSRSFAGVAPGAKAKLAPLMREAIAAGRASGELFAGNWHNIGTPTQLAELDRQLRAAS